MSLMILPIWSGPDGQDTGPLAITCRTDSDAEQLVKKWLTSGRRNVRVSVSDDVTWAKIATYRPNKPVRVVSLPTDRSAA